MQPFFLPTHVVTALGWMLLHFVWQGALVAGILAVVLWARRGASSNERYLHSCAAMLLVAALPLLTFVLVWRVAYPWPTIQTEATTVTTYDPTSGIREKALSVFAAAQTPVGENEAPHRTVADRLLPYFPGMVWIWFGGIVLFTGRLLLSWLLTQRLRWVGLSPVAEPIRRSLEGLAVRMEVYKPVWLMVSSAVTVPTLIGWLRPLVLLPASALSGLSPAQLEAILAHELAHVRRHDYLVNLLQSFIETLFFFHPAVWWISKLIREERENCCDDLAVRLLGDTLEYSKALAEMEQLRLFHHQTRLAAGGGNLLGRIQRLVAPGSVYTGRHTPFTAFAVMALSISTMLAYGSNRPEEIAEAGRTAEEARYTNMFIQACRIPVTIRMEDVTLQQACDEITRQTGIPIRIPTDSVGERVTMDYQDISAGMVLTSMFNLMLMDQAFDPSIVALRVKWWDDCGPQPWRLRKLSVRNFYARQELFRSKHHPIARYDAERLSMRQALGQITERTGIRFAFQAGVGDLPVTIRARNTEAWKIVQAIVDQHRINYDYGDDGTVMIFRPGEGHELFQDGE